MDYYLDIAWEKIALGLKLAGEQCFALIQNFHFLGPVALICMLAVFTLLITKTLNRFIITKRYQELEKEYYHWYHLRQEALRWDDTEKGKILARNIDQAELNRAYYDYFFEGLLLGIIRKIVPIFFIFAFINEYYKPEHLVQMFGKGYVLRMGTLSGEPLFVGAPFWYFLCLVTCYLLWPLAKWLIKKVYPIFWSRQNQFILE